MPFDFNAGPKFMKGPAFGAGPKVGKPAPDPLADVDYSGDLAAYRQRAKTEADRFRAATDSEYWVAVCFKTREDKERFLAGAGLLDYGDKYLDGYIAAKKLGIPMDKETT